MTARALLGLGAALVALTPAQASAQEDLDDVEPTPVVEPSAEPGAEPNGEPGAAPERPDASAGKDSQRGSAKDAPSAALQLGGRVFVRATAFDTDGAPWQSALALESVRLGASYRWKKKLRAKLVLEAAGRATVRDALLELPLGHGLHLQVGRFKGPHSAVERASAWDLPSIGRGDVAEILDDGIGLTGRRDGVELGWSAKKRGPRVALVVSQALSTAGDASPRPVRDGAGLTVALRGELRPVRGVTLGVTASQREVNYVSDVGRYWAGGVDAELDLEGSGLSAWADVLVGQSHLAAAGPDDPTTFLAAQLIAGWRFGGQERDRPFLQPFVRGAFFNPDLDHRLDQVLDVSVGVTGGRWERWRAQLAVGNLGTWSRRPEGLVGFGKNLDDRLEITAQLGAAF